MSDLWPPHLAAVQVRVARPTQRLHDVVAFYAEGLGLPVIGSFTGHAGYDGVMIGLPDRQYHLEFTQHVIGGPSEAPTKDNLLVFYIPDRERLSALVQRMRQFGCQPVPPENPYWEVRGFTFEDPDGWRVVLMHSTGI